MKILKKLFGKNVEKKNGKTALIVDDENNIRQILKIRLAQLGFDVLEAGSVEEGWKVIEKNPKISLFVIDVKLPGANGTVLARKIRKNKDTKKRPIIFISGHVVPSDMKKLSDEISNCACLAKPIKAEAINTTVKQAMDGGFKD